MEILVETARLWHSLGHHDHHGIFHFDGVTGPDEYSAVADDNLYTNLMAQQNLREAADVVERYTERAAALGVDDEEAAAWRDAAEAVALPFNETLGVHEQSAGFTGHQMWDFAATGPDQYPLMLHFPYFDLYRKQVIKQADLALALYKRGDAFDAEQKARNFDYYEQMTVRDSSLSACCQAVMAAEVGHLRLAYDYVGEAALMDLADLESNTRDGLHIASLAGAWIALVAGFGGMRLRHGMLDFSPLLPEQLSRLAFTVQVRGRRLRVEIRSRTAVYTLLEGEPLELCHCGGRFTLSAGEPQTHQVRRPPPRPEPSPPQGRHPARRRRRGRCRGRAGAVTPARLGAAAPCRREPPPGAALRRGAAAPAGPATAGAPRPARRPAAASAPTPTGGRADSPARPRRRRAVGRRRRGSAPPRAAWRS